MNYYEARQTKTKTDGAIWPVGYCRDHKPHATPREAEDCFRRYLLDGQREEEYTSWHGCEAIVDGEKCDTPTKKALTTRPPLGHGYALCDEHRTPETLEALTQREDGDDQGDPEKVSLRITASY